MLENFPHKLTLCAIPFFSYTKPIQKWLVLAVKYAISVMRKDMKYSNALLKQRGLRGRRSGKKGREIRRIRIRG